VLFLGDEPMFPGYEVEWRIVGVLRANQRENGKENRNDRLIAIADGSALYAGVHQLSDLEPAVLQQIGQFFTNYQRVLNIEFEVIKRGESEAAMALVRDSIKNAA
jgi:inorganic pyrophosphatase